MQIYPCPCTISLKDGSTHTLFEFDDFLELVENYMGDNAEAWLSDHVAQAEQAADYTQARVATDLTAYEANLENNREAFEGIQLEAATILGVLQEKRISREKIAYAARKISKIISDQI